MSEKIKFQIETLDYQEDAVNSVIDLLKGIDRYSVSSIYSNARSQISAFNPHPESNVRFNAGTRLIRNMQEVQYRNGLFKDSEIVGDIPQFTIEMETGTGKTFVYLETILRLWRDFGGQFKKFIIVVPSNPILLGVKKSIEMFADYFRPQFGNIDIDQHFFVYDKSVSPETVTSKLVESTDLSIMLVTNHSFNKDTNRLRKGKEDNPPVWEDIKDIAPIIIIDEPQKLDGNGNKKTASMKAIEELAPLMVLRYSATHKNLYNPIFKLDSYDAYKKKLVKGIKVKTIHSLTPKDFPYVRYVGFTKELRARIEIFRKEQGDKIRCRKCDVDNGASLGELSGGLPQYQNWYIAAQPRKGSELQISKDDGEILYIPEGKSNDEVDRSAAVEKQMEIAIKEHIKKQISILAGGKKIKVLTLFFVDSVAKVRGSDEDGRGEYLKIFDRVLDDIRNSPDLMQRSVIEKYPEELKLFDMNVPAAAFREGYFAIDKKKNEVDIKGWNSDLSDEDVAFDAKTQEDIDRGIDLILNKKDELLSFGEPLSFIFSHSALREGWDNPNVFVIVTLKEGGSDIAKKQEIGRGLRLPVNAAGERCRDSAVNELTVVANDYYDHFSDRLRRDYEDKMSFKRDEVSADIIMQTVINAGIPADKVEHACDALRNELTASSMIKIDNSGKMLLKKGAENFQSILFSDPVLIEHSQKIIEAFVNSMKDKGSKKINIANGDEEPAPNGMQKYITEAAFDRLYHKLLEILQKRSLYKYDLDKEKFIAEASAEINSELAKKNDFIKFEIAGADVSFNESRNMHMTNETKQVESSRNYTAQYEVRPLFELVNAIMFSTMLPRLAAVRIIKGLNADARRKINKQDYLEVAIKTIEKLLIKYKNDGFTEAEIISGISADEKKIFEVDNITGDEDPDLLFEPKPQNRRAMNLMYKFDSAGEKKFADELDEDSSVLLYTKLKKGGFVIETPVGDYSPDWAIVYKKDNGSVALYFIAETKFLKEYGGLTDDERIKIKCAKMHFSAVNTSMPDIVKYAWVNAYNDETASQSFPQVFMDENYEDTTQVERAVCNV